MSHKYWNKTLCTTAKGRKFKKYERNTLRYEDMKTWEHGEMRTWEHEGMRTWSPEYIRTWKDDDMRIWRHENIKTVLLEVKLTFQVVLTTREVHTCAHTPTHIWTNGAFTLLNKPWSHTYSLKERKLCVCGWGGCWHTHLFVCVVILHACHSATGKWDSWVRAEIKSSLRTSCNKIKGVLLAHPHWDVKHTSL